MPAARKDLQHSLKSGQIEPVYFLYGTETYLRDQAVRAITDAALSGTLLREFNDSSFSLLNDDVRDAIAAAEQLPMMSERRVVRLRNFSRLRESDEELLLEYVERPVPTSVVLFVGDDLDKRKKLAKKLMVGAAFEFQPLKSNELPTWIKARLKELDVEIEPPAIRRLVEVVTSDLLTLTNELNKLAAAALPNGRITVDLVDQLISRSREHMNWDLTDNIVSHNRAAALKVVREFLEDGVEPVLVIGIIAGAFRRLELAKELFDRRASPNEIFKAVRVAQWKQREYLGMLARLNARDLARNIQRIAETDLAIKTSKATPRMQVEMLVCELLMS